MIFAPPKKKSILPWKISLSLTPEHLQQNDVVEQLVQLIGGINGASIHKDLLLTVISEIYSNCLEHGLLLLDSNIKTSPDGFERYYQLREKRLGELENGSIQINISVELPEADSIKICFRDTGPGFNLSKTLDQSDTEEGLYYGRGINLVKSLCESVDYSNDGRSVSIIFSLKPFDNTVKV